MWPLKKGWSLTSLGEEKTHPQHEKNISSFSYNHGYRGKLGKLEDEGQAAKSPN